MARQETVNEIVARILKPVILKFSARVESQQTDKSVVLPNVGYGLQNWIAEANTFSNNDLDAASVSGDGRVTIKVADLEFRLLATDVRIVRDHVVAAAAADYLKDRDEKQTRHVPLKRIFTPSLFPKIDYDEAREQWIVAGEAKRFRVAVSGLPQYALQFDIETENWKAQETARIDQLAVEQLVREVFARHPDCKNTDALMRKLHGWEPKG